MEQFPGDPSTQRVPRRAGEQADLFSPLKAAFSGFYPLSSPNTRLIALSKLDLEIQEALLQATLADVARYKEDRFFEDPLKYAHDVGSKGKCISDYGKSLVELGADLTGKLITPILPKPDLGPDITNPVAK